MADSKAIDLYALSRGVSRKPAWNLVKTAQRKSQLRADGKLGLVDLIDETITYPTAEGYPWHHEGEYLEFLHITDSKEFEQ